MFNNKQKVLQKIGDFSVIGFSWRGTDEEVCIVIQPQNFGANAYKRYMYKVYIQI